MAIPRTVLLIDDEENFCKLAKMNLEQTGKYKVFISFNGKDGIKKTKEIKPDVVLLDIMMPKMDGFEVLKTIKEDKETMRTPVIMLSAIDDDKSKIKASEMYSHHYITKPVNPDELMSKIDWVLNLAKSNT